MGASLSGPGYSPKGGAADASPAEPSIPSAAKPPKWGKLYAEHCPVRTCPASRHARIIAEDILRDKKSPVRKMLLEAGYEPDHWASSIEATVTSLWEARRWLKWEELPVTGKLLYNGHWVPDLDAIARP